MHNIDTIYVMKLSRLVNYSLLILITLCIFHSANYPAPVHAQSIPTNLNSIVLTPSSNNPTPGETITITAASYSFDINSAVVTWIVDGKQVQKSIGATILSVQAPALGKKTLIRVTAATTDGSVYSTSITLGSGSIDLITETDGYTPPFFAGKVPYVFQNTLTVIAIPHLVNSAGKEYDPANLIYQWKKDDGTVLQSQSGYGKQAISLKGNIIPRPYYLLVTATSRDGNAQAESAIQIQPTSPSITFYIDDALYGPLFNKAITGPVYIGNQKETSAFASLYGFNFSNTIANDLTLNWMINNTLHPELASNKSIVLRAPDGTSGTSHIELGVQGINNILQSAGNSFDVSFDTTNSTSNATTPVSL